MKVIPDSTGPGQESVWSYPRPAVAELTCMAFFVPGVMLETGMERT